MIAEQEGDGKQVRSTTHDALLESGHGEGSLKDLNNLTKYVASLDFWEDANELQKHTEENLCELLSVFDDCGGSYQSLHHAIAEITLNMDENMHIRYEPTNDPSMSMDSMGNFIMNDANFWDEIIFMENETKECIKKNSKIVGRDNLATKSTVPSTELLNDLLSVFDEFSGEIKELSEQLSGASEHMIATTEVKIDGDSDGRYLSLHIDSAARTESGILDVSAEIDFLNESVRAEAPLQTTEEETISTSTIDAPLPPSVIERQKNIELSSSISDDDQIATEEEVVVLDTHSTGPPSSATTPVPPAPPAPAAATPITSAESVIRAGTLWDDVNITLLKPTQLLLLDQAAAHAYDDSPEVVALRRLYSELELRAKGRPNLLLLVTLLVSGGAAVAGSLFQLLNQHSSVAQFATPFTLSNSRVQAALWVSAFVVNVVAVSIPGRLDRMYREDKHIKPWQSLFEPVGWAFAIWAPIYLLGFIVSACVIYISALSECSALSAAILRVLPCWVAGNWLQAIWCCVFRPEFSAKLWIPTIALILASLCIYCAHVALVATTSAEATYPLGEGSIPAWATSMFLLLTRSALSIHSTWLLASALINGNSWIVVTYGLRARSLQTTAAFASAFLMTCAGIALTVHTQDPCFALTAAWALDAMSAKSAQKALPVKTESSAELVPAVVKGAVSADVHESLAGVESLLSGALKCVGVGIMLSPTIQALLRTAGMS